MQFGGEVNHSFKQWHVNQDTIVNILTISYYTEPWRLSLGVGYTVIHQQKTESSYHLHSFVKCTSSKEQNLFNSKLTNLTAYNTLQLEH
jgi:hypothetical protein